MWSDFNVYHYIWRMVAPSRSVLPMQIDASKDFVEAVDAWRVSRPVIPSREQAFRILAEMGLALAERFNAVDEDVGD